jgi:hypothetical protein
MSKLLTLSRLYQPERGDAHARQDNAAGSFSPLAVKQKIDPIG